MDEPTREAWHERLAKLEIRSPLSHPLCFKKELHIGDDAYGTLRIVNRLQDLTQTFGAAGAGAAIASSPIVATTFFPAGILGALGLASATTPIGWVIGAGVLSGTAWGLITRQIRSVKEARTDEVPKWINTPLDELAVGLFELMGTLAVKLATIDDDRDQREHDRIMRYFTRSWGYHEQFVDLGIQMADEADTDFRTVVTRLAEFTKANRDCNAPAVGKNVMHFLRDVASADHTITPGEKAALADAEDVLVKDLKILAGQKPSRKNGSRTRTAQHQPAGGLRPSPVRSDAAEPTEHAQEAKHG